MLTGVKIIQDDESEQKLTAETVARNFGLESCDDFMTALKDTMGEDDYDYK